VWGGSGGREVVPWGVLVVDTENLEKNSLFSHFVFGCGGHGSRWWCHLSTSQMQCGSSIWLGSISISHLRWGGGDLSGVRLHALGWFLSEKKPVYCRYKLVVKD
jgi:hypothetical protein